jgi:hypothetical protein
VSAEAQLHSCAVKSQTALQVDCKKTHSVSRYRSLVGQHRQHFRFAIARIPGFASVLVAWSCSSLGRECQVLKADIHPVTATVSFLLG